MVEIQIRNETMHKTAEEGIAAHWRYKEGKEEEDELDKQLGWLRQLIDQQKELKDPSEFMENLKIDLFQHEVFVFTPKGSLFKLPRNSSPVDFAFAVHSKVGMQCIGAKVNGRIVPLNSTLRSGDLVEIITSANQRPHTDWLKFVQTTKARHQIRKYLREVQFEQSTKLGEEILQKTLKKYDIKLSADDLAGIAQGLNFPDVKHLEASLGQGDTSIQSVLRKIYPEGEPKEKQESLFTKFIRRVKDSAGIRVQGMDNMMISFGKCCQPVPGDEIIGFVTKGKGLAIHRNDCRNAIKLMQFPERMMTVKWDVEPDKRFMVKIRMVGEDRVNFLRDITQSLSSLDTNIVNMVMKTRDKLMSALLLIEVKNLQHLTKVINAVSKVKGIITVERMDGMSIKPNHPPGS
jgi:GTP pyrophosphokinase